MKHVKSTDPRKRQIVQQLKQASGGNKITNVRDHEDGTFSGDALKYVGGKYENLGRFEIKTLQN